MAGAGDRTEKPTARRLTEARKRGQVARSGDVAHAASLGASLLALAWFGDDMLRRLASIATAGLESLSTIGRRPIQEGDLTAMAVDHGVALVWIVGPVAALAAFTSIAAFVVQSGWVFTTQPLSLNFDRLNPVNGVQRFKPSRAGVELLKA